MLNAKYYSLLISGRINPPAHRFSIPAFYSLHLDYKRPAGGRCWWLRYERLRLWNQDDVIRAGRLFHAAVSSQRWVADGPDIVMAGTDIRRKRPHHTAIIIKYVLATAIVIPGVAVDSLRMPSIKKRIAIRQNGDMSAPRPMVMIER